MSMVAPRTSGTVPVKSSQIRHSALLHIAVSSLKSKKLRSTLTAMGVAIGTGAVFLLLSFGMGLQDLVAKQVTQGQSINTIDVNTAGSRLLKMTSDTTSDIAAIANVKSASGFYAKASKLSVDGAAADVVLYGVDDLYIQTTEFVMAAGTMINPESSSEVVVSTSILDAAGARDYKKVVGTHVTVKLRLDSEKVVEKKLKVTGVVSAMGGSEAFVSQRLFSDSGVTEFAGMKVLSSERQHVPQIRHAIESLGYDTTSPVDTLEQVDQFFKVLRVVLVSLGSIGVVIAILGMVNTLTVSLLERTKEVALMLALGARPRDINLLFIYEAVILSVVGGIAGIVGASLTAAVIDIVLNQLARSRGAESTFTVFAVPLWMVPLTLLAMATVGYVVAYLPARRASRINAMEALRRD